MYLYRHDACLLVSSEKGLDLSALMSHPQSHDTVIVIS